MSQHGDKEEEEEEKEEEEEEEKEKDDTESDESSNECDESSDKSEYLTSEEINKAPTFVPTRLPPPKPLSLHVEETLQEAITVREDPVVTKGTSPKELLHSGGESIMDVEDDSTATETDVRKYFERSASETRREDEMEGRNSGGLTAETASLKPKESCLGLEDCPHQSCLAGIPELGPCPPEGGVHPSNLNQNEACAQVSQQKSVSSSTEATSVVKKDCKSLEDEQSFILTLVDISNYSTGLDASPFLEDISEDCLPAPIIIKPIQEGEKAENAAESTGCLTTADDDFAEPLCSYMEHKQLESTPSEPSLDLRTTQKRPSVDEDLDCPPSKKCLSAARAEVSLETAYKDYSPESADSPERACANPFQNTDDLSKENLLKSLLLFDSMTLLSEKKDHETSEKLETLPPGKEASKQEKEVVMSGLTSKSKGLPVNGQQKQEDVHESALLGHAGSLPSSSKSPLHSTGFLPFTCKRSSLRSTEHAEWKATKSQSSQFVIPKQTPGDTAPSTEEDKESHSLCSTRALSSREDKAAAEAAVMAPTNKPPEEPLLCDEEEKEEEPTRISEYFFSDIFMEVDDSE